MLNEDMCTAGEVVADIQLSLSPFPNIGGLELLHGRSQIGDITEGSAVASSKNSLADVRWCRVPAPLHCRECHPSRQ